jgi:SAM-dependent methyltransferase
MNDKKQSEFGFRPTWYPAEGLVKFSARYLQSRVGINSWEKRKVVRRILDAGCGVGRDVIFFSEQGFDVYGIDISEENIKIANNWLQSKGLKGTVQVGDVTLLPFDNEYFDVIVSYGVLDYMVPSDFKKAMKEISRVCAKNGYVYITLISTEDSEFGRGQEVDHNTFLLENGYARGTAIHYFDLNEIREAFKDFKVFDIMLQEEKFPDLYTVDKAFLQSSTGLKKYVNLSNSIDLNLKYARWHIAAEKI